MTQPSGKNEAGERATRRLADMVDAPPTVSFSQAFDSETLIKIGVLALLWTVLHAQQIRWLFLKWGQENWQHGYAIPLFSLYLLYSRRDELLAICRRTFWPALPAMALCFAGQMIAVYWVHNDWLRGLCMIGMLFNMVLFLAGPKMIRITWLPILFLIFSLPLPGRLYTSLSLPMQNLAARGAVLTLRLFQVNITNSASTLELVSRSGQLRELAVAEACNGMKLLTAFMAIGVAAAYLDVRPMWHRLILVAAAMPIALFCNIIRVALTCWMTYIDKAELGQGLMHTITGLVMLLPAFGMLWGLGWILKKLVVEEDVEEPAAPAPAGSEGPKA